MAFEDTYLVSKKLSVTAPDELDELETWLSAPLPRGYREYMTTLGVGVYCDLIRVLAPRQIREGCNQWHEYLRKYYQQFWGASEAILPLDEAVAGVFFADTLDGDGIYYHPHKAGRLFMLPRNDTVVCWLEMGFDDPLNWKSAKVEQRFVEPPFRYFEPANGDRRFIEFFTDGAFDIASLAEDFRQRWSSQEMRSISEPGQTLLFPRAISGRVQLTQECDDPRVAIRVDYDDDCRTEVKRFANDLKAMGFYETGRSRAAPRRRHRPA